MREPRRLHQLRWTCPPYPMHPAAPQRANNIYRSVTQYRWIFLIFKPRHTGYPVARVTDWPQAATNLVRLSVLVLFSAQRSDINVRLPHISIGTIDPFSALIVWNECQASGWSKDANQYYQLLRKYSSETRFTNVLMCWPREKPTIRLTASIARPFLLISLIFIQNYSFEVGTTQIRNAIQVHQFHAKQQ